tara:strand:+ start:153 stop:524 length:372 start_codon:yes stop_codon:yes gene_type:complete
MAAPNIINATSIVGKTVYDTDIDATASSFVTNSASSNKVFKINSLVISNIDGTNDATITATLNSVGSGTLLSTLASTITVPSNSTLVIISKDTAIYLEEDREIRLTASAAGDLSGTCSYDEIS